MLRHCNGFDIFQSTRPLRGGTVLEQGYVDSAAISIHPPLAGRDCHQQLRPDRRAISIHPPLAGRDSSIRCMTSISPISIHPPLAGRDQGSARAQQRDPISIHPPLAGRDPNGKQGGMHMGRFQSTRPLRGGTAILHKKTVQNIAYCTKSAFTLAVLSGFLALMRPFFCQTCTNFGANLPKNRCSLPVRTLIPSGPPPADSRH